jgi:hypothetical protein
MRSNGYSVTPLHGIGDNLMAASALGRNPGFVTST